MLEWYKDKRVCVTGATGLIGSYVVKLLKESGATVTAMIHHRGPNELVQLADYYIKNACLEDRDGAWFDAVMHCAGITGGVAMPQSDPVSYVGPATAMAINVLHACHEAGIQRVGMLSSTTVYAPTPEPCREGVLDSHDEPYPLYRGIAESKRFIEKLCRYYHETTGIGVGIVRPSGAYGRYDNFDERTSHVIPGLINRALRLEPGQPLEIWGDGCDVRDFVHAEDVARGLLLAVALKPDAEPINIASGVAVTTGALASCVMAACGHDPLMIQPNPAKPTALRSRTVDITKAKKLLGFEAQISLEAGIQDTVNWRRQCQI
jgi:GDP-L-fucose synthase